MIDTNKHAYLVLCHDNFDQLFLLLKLLDYSENDIYIHVDKKVKLFPKSSIQKACSSSNVFFTKRIQINWGGFSQVKAELVLLQTAVRKGYLYYHLISGADLPLHSQSFIHDFFDKESALEYLRVENITGDDNKYLCSRLKTFHFFQEYIGRGSSNIFLNRLVKAEKRVQKRLKVNRIDESLNYYYGDNWFSITDNLAKWIVQNEKKIRKHMRFSVCADEIFMQTLAMMSPYKDNIVGHCARLIDWSRGRPYVFRTEDYEELINSDKMFARKFDMSVDKEIVLSIYNYLLSIANKEKGCCTSELFE